MYFSSLRLQGFKSFVDATEIPIENGLTGVVGPNGCGKSNLVEALRWVMGESSAKRMRGGEMDDVIFGGSLTRPARNIAEVSLKIDNSDRRAPAAMNDAEELQVARRIERSKGSGYRVNGKDTRARDVQLLFADAATGARSTGMVSQGRIGALINAKPQERRILLEEAANIRGLHSRRHEAELRLKGAESNLERLEDVLTALQGQMHGLKQQARQATRYRRVSEQIRQNESILLHRRWTVTLEERVAAAAVLREIQDEVTRLTETAAGASTRQAAAAAGLPALRDTEVAAAAELQRLTLAGAELDNEEKRISNALGEAEVRLRQIGDDLGREAALAEEAQAAQQRLLAEHEGLSAVGADAAEQIAKAAAALSEANRRADELETEVASLTETIAVTEARRGALQRQGRQSQDRIDRLDRQAGMLDQQKIQLEANAVDPADVEAADQALLAAETTSTEAASAADAAEAGRASADEAARAASQAHQQIESEIGRARAEAEGLRALLAEMTEGDGVPVLDQLTVTPGYEVALGAALGEDLSAPLLDEADAAVAGRSWRPLGEVAGGTALPSGVEALSAHVQGPVALSPRLAQIGVVENAEAAARRQSELGVGQRLVSRDGGLWRWDGFVVPVDAPSAQAIRLRQRNRLTALDGELAEIEGRLTTSEATFFAASETQSATVATERSAREAVTEAYKAADRARNHRSVLATKLTEISTQVNALEESRQRLAEEIIEARQLVAEAVQAESELENVDALRATSAAGRRALGEQRETLAEARSEHDRVARETDSRQARISAIEGERLSWADRVQRAAARLAELQERRDGASEEIERLRARPSEIAAQKETLIESIRNAEARRQVAGDALAQAETVLAEADRQAKEAERALATARENRIRAESVLEQINQNLSALRERIAERLECAPDEILAKAEIDPDEQMPDPDKVEETLERLIRERERIGPVNLRAEQEVEELSTQIAGMENERDDLIAAISRLRSAISALNREGRQRLLQAFEKVNAHFQDLFVKLFGGGRAHLALTEAEDPLDAGLEIMASPPGKRLQTMSLLSGGEQALTALALVFAAFLTNPSPICVLDEVDAPLDDSNVDRFCSLLSEIADATGTRFMIITHHRLTMARMDRLFGVTMSEPGVSQLVSVDLQHAERLRESA